MIQWVLGAAWACDSSAKVTLKLLKTVENENQPSFSIFWMPVAVMIRALAIFLKWALSLSCRKQWGSFQRQKLSRPSLVVFQNITPKSIPSPRNTLSPEFSKTNSSINSLEACVRVVSLISLADSDLLCHLWNVWQKGPSLWNERLSTSPTGSRCGAQSPGTPGCCLNSNRSCAQGPCQIFLLLLPSSLRAQISKHAVISTITHILSRWAVFYVYKFPFAPGPFRRMQTFPTLKERRIEELKGAVSWPTPKTSKPFRVGLYEKRWWRQSVPRCLISHPLLITGSKIRKTG